MTGFGVASRPWDGGPQAGTVHVEVRSVNSRFREVKIRQPFGPALDHELKRQVEGRIARGRVELKIHVEPVEAAGEGARLQALAKLGIDPARGPAVVAAAREMERLAAEAGLEVRASSAAELLRFMAGARAPERAEDSTTSPTFLPDLVDEALDQLCNLRSREGQALQRALSDLADLLKEQVERLRASLEGEPGRIAERVNARVEELTEQGGGTGPDPVRLAQEVALLLARGDVEEELTRIDSHLEQLRRVMEGDSTPGQGKTLDFLCQELLREAATIGGKITSHSGSMNVIEAKGIIERIREQVQNVE
jgi:uncharacterized protein (TIGR00255 family)